MSSAERGDKQFLEERGFGQSLGFGKQPALLVVDLIMAFTDAARPLGSNLDSQIAATNQLIGAMRKRGAPIIFTTVSYSDPGLKDAGIWGLKMKGTSSLIEQGDGPSLDPRLDKTAGDPLLAKKYASCFFGTDLVPRLVTDAVDTLIITGCTTSGCVRASAVDAIQNGFRPIVVREAVGDRSQAAHDQSLADLHWKYADVVSLATALDYLNAEGRA
jgi:maleamate amidohydrolase